MQEILLFKVNSVLFLQAMLNHLVDSGSARWNTTPIADDLKRKPFFIRSGYKSSVGKRAGLRILNSSLRIKPPL